MTQPTVMGRAPWTGVWHLADPKITLASVASMIVGAAAAAADGPIAWGWLALTVLGIFFLEAAKNASGEVFDFDSGTDLAVADEDRSPFSGGKRVLVDGLMTRRQTWVAAFAFYALGSGAGLAVVVWREPLVLAVGAAGVALAFFYHSPPFKLSYRGLGELAVAITYGPLIACGTYLVQHGAIGPSVVLPSIPLGLAIGNFLLVNELPDLKADRGAGKRTLAVRLGASGAARLYTAVVAATYLGVVALPLLGVTPWTGLGLVGLPLAARAALRVRRAPERTPDIVPAQGWSLVSFLLLALGLGAGLVLGGG